MEKLSDVLKEDNKIGLFLLLVNTYFNNKTKYSEKLDDYFEFRFTTLPHYWDELNKEIIKKTLINDLIFIIRTPGFDKIPQSVLSSANFITGDFRKKILMLCKIYKV